MAKPERFETLILGSGTGGKLMAWHMAGSGRRTAVVERRWIGGSCPNIACMPSKNEIFSARVAHLARHGAQFGTLAGPVAVDMATVRQRKRNMVEAQIAKHLQNYKTSGAELIMGAGRFVGPKTLEVLLNDGGTRVLAGDQVFLNVGTHAAIPSVPGLEAARPLTHIEALELDYLPQHLIVVGGGYVGLELAQAYRRFGSSVTIIESGPQLMSREDFDVSHEMRRILSDEGIQVLVKAELLRVQGQSGKEVTLVVRTTSGGKTSRVATFSSPQGVFRTPPESGLKRSALSWTVEAIFVSMNDWKQVCWGSGLWAKAPAARNSRTYPKTIFGLFATIWPEGSEARAIDRCHIACSLILHSRTSD
jgi:pyruvate/2-oxoglutarate dehydrogenase complex dihydrolipoamide dehydrogenase (E3) component